ncbi:zinc finger c-x8-C-x5-C-x3-H type (and similar) domain-containing protein [Ditylenchus destructor]|nr:zinc finger c-x8-C-x5-C-x3-H type (and similar) domain-containing protein [Ditylenchus destructor]
MVLASPVLGRSNHQSLSRRPTACTSGTHQPVPSFIPLQAGDQHALYAQNASAFGFNTDSVSLLHHTATMRAAARNVAMPDHCWNNLFGNSQLSSSTPSLNTAQEPSKGRISHQTPNFQCGTSNKIHPAQNQLTHTNSGPPSSGDQKQQQQNQLNSQQKNPKLYKTELCRSWVDTGRCNYGERCQYAHGDTEKRPIPRHPKYKTEACQSYHKTGYCPYGPRCHFIHNEDPAQIQQQQLLHAQNSANSTPLANGTPQMVSTPTNPGTGSNPNLLFLRQMNSLGNLGGSSSSPATPHHMSAGLIGNARAPPPVTTATQMGTYFPQHQILTSTQSWSLGVTNTMPMLSTRASNPIANSPIYSMGHQQAQIFDVQPNTMNQSASQHKSKPSRMQLPNGPGFSVQQMDSQQICLPMKSQPGVHPAFSTLPQTNQQTLLSSSAGDCSPLTTSSLPSSGGDSGTESPTALITGSFSPTFDQSDKNGELNFNRLSPSSFHTTLLMGQVTDNDRRNSEGSSTMLDADRGTLLAEQMLAGTPTQFKQSTQFAIPGNLNATVGSSVAQLRPSQELEQLTTSLAASLIHDTSELDLTPPVADQTKSENNSGQHPIWVCDNAGNTAADESNRRASGSSLGSSGQSGHSTYCDTPLSGISTVTVGSGSDIETWVRPPSGLFKSTQQPTEQSQQAGRLPVFERLSNGPF